MLKILILLQKYFLKPRRFFHFSLLGIFPPNISGGKNSTKWKKQLWIVIYMHKKGKFKSIYEIIKIGKSYVASAKCCHLPPFKGTRNEFAVNHIWHNTKQSHLQIRYIYLQTMKWYKTKQKKVMFCILMTRFWFYADLALRSKRQQQFQLLWFLKHHTQATTHPNPQTIYVRAKKI